MTALRVIQVYRKVGTWNITMWPEGEKKTRALGTGPHRVRGKGKRRLQPARQGEPPTGKLGARVRDLILNITSYLTQIIMGHGGFQSCLHNIGKAFSDTSIHSSQSVKHDAVHTLLVCLSLEAAIITMRTRVLEPWLQEGDLYPKRPFCSSEKWTFAVHKIYLRHNKLVSVRGYDG